MSSKYFKVFLSTVLVVIVNRICLGVIISSEIRVVVPLAVNTNPPEFAVYKWCQRNQSSLLTEFKISTEIKQLVSNTKQCESYHVNCDGTLETHYILCLIMKENHDVFGSHKEDSEFEKVDNVLYYGNSYIEFLKDSGSVLYCDLSPESEESNNNKHEISVKSNEKTLFQAMAVKNKTFTSCSTKAFLSAVPESLSITISNIDDTISQYFDKEMSQLLSKSSLPYLIADASLLDNPQKQIETTCHDKPTTLLYIDYKNRQVKAAFLPPTLEESNVSLIKLDVFEMGRKDFISEPNRSFYRLEFEGDDKQTRNAPILSYPIENANYNPLRKYVATFTFKDSKGNINVVTSNTIDIGNCQKNIEVCFIDIKDDATFWIHTTSQPYDSEPVEKKLEEKNGDYLENESLADGLSSRFLRKKWTLFGNVITSLINSKNNKQVCYGYLRKYHDTNQTLAQQYVMPPPQMLSEQMYSNLPIHDQFFVIEGTCPQIDDFFSNWVDIKKDFSFYSYTSSSIDQDIIHPIYILIRPCLSTFFTSNPITYEIKRKVASFLCSTVLPEISTILVSEIPSISHEISDVISKLFDGELTSLIASEDVVGFLENTLNEQMTTKVLSKICLSTIDTDSLSTIKTKLLLNFKSFFPTAPPIQDIDNGFTHVHGPHSMFDNLNLYTLTNASGRIQIELSRLQSNSNNVSYSLMYSDSTLTFECLHQELIRRRVISK